MNDFEAAIKPVVDIVGREVSGELMKHFPLDKALDITEILMPSIVISLAKAGHLNGVFIRE